jgi:hypothetical protein
MPPLTPTQQIINEQRQARMLARAIREARPRHYAFGTEISPETAAGLSRRDDGESIRRFNENTRNRALLLAASKRLRIIYFLGSTLLLFVVTPLLWFAPPQLASHFGPSIWWLLPYLGAIVAPLCALRGYFIWVRSHWYRWIGKGIKEDYEEGEVL